MGLKLKVKVGNITNLSDARYCAGMGVDWLGFNVETIDLKTYEDITGWVTGPSFVLEVNQDTALDLVSKYAADSVEIPITRLPDLDQIHHATIFVSLEMKDWITQRDNLIQRKNNLSVVIFKSGLGDDHLENEILQEASLHFDVLMGFPVSLDRIPDHLRVRVGYHLQGSSEERPGLKDYQSLADVLESLEVD